MQGAPDSSLKLPSVLDLAASEALLDTMRQACDAQTATVDASGVDVVTSPCMQVILAALKASPGMRIEKPSEAFVQAFADLALEWRQDDQEVEQEAAIEDTQNAAAPAPINPEDDTEAAFLAAAQQYTEASDEPADKSAAAPEAETANEDAPPAEAAAADEAPAPDIAEDDSNVTSDTQTPEASMAKRILTIDD